MRSVSLAAIFFLMGCAFGCKSDDGQEMPAWEGSFCEVAKDANGVNIGVTCEGKFISFNSKDFDLLWITNKKGITCIYRQFINNVNEWTDPHKKCEYEGAISTTTSYPDSSPNRLESAY